MIGRSIAAALGVVLCSSDVLAAQLRPNVILIMADDLGYNDLSCYGSPTMKTPVLDKMASEGIRLTSFYAGATVCTPSRMALLSGSYPTRLGWEGGVLGYGMKGYTGLPLDVVTIAEAFRDGGYRTAISGKWHLGTKDLLPMHHGFESTYFIESSNNLTKKLYRGEDLLNPKFENRLFTETFTKEVVRLIDKDSDKPFFIYVPYTAPHFPAEAHPDWKGKSKNGAYGDVVEELDHRIGEILAALKKKQIDDKTIIVFLSDNGPEGLQKKYAKATPFSGGKWGDREGGTRVACIVRYPGVIKPGQVDDNLTAAIDLFPTLAHACGVEIKIPEGGQKLDGVSVWGTWIGRAAKHAREDLLYWHGWGRATAIRQDNWKLFFGESKGGAPVKDGPALYNLKKDLAEAKNISAQHPEKVEAMLALARERLEDVHKNHVRMAAWKDSRARVKNWQPTRNWGKWLKTNAEGAPN